MYIVGYIIVSQLLPVMFSLLLLYTEHMYFGVSSFPTVMFAFYYGRRLAYIHGSHPGDSLLYGISNRNPSSRGQRSPTTRVFCQRLNTIRALLNQLFCIIYFMVYTIIYWEYFELVRIYITKHYYYCIVHRVTKKKISKKSINYSSRSESIMCKWVQL